MFCPCGRQAIAVWYDKGMEIIGVTVVLALLGAAMGSFACCQAWRLKNGDDSEWSHCMSCGYRLRWFDNIPVVSWLLLKGKCRKCGKKIGWAEILAELGLAVVFATSFYYWPWRTEVLALEIVETLKYGIFLALLVALTVLFVFDARWKEMPTRVLFIAVGMGAILGVTKLGFGGFKLEDLLNVALAVVVLPMFYYLLYKISHETWVGGGDWILSLALALALGDLFLALACLFLANMLGSVVMLPVIAFQRKKQPKIPLGPFLITAFVVVYLAQKTILSFISV